MTEPGLALRAATTADLADVAKIEAACFASDPWPRESFEGFVDRAGVTFIVAETTAGSQARIVGYAVFIEAADEGEILNLAVAAEARGAGVGGALLDAILETASKHGIRAVYLEVRASNEGARQLYESRGFAEAGRRRNYYQQPAEDGLILQRIEP